MNDGEIKNIMNIVKEMLTKSDVFGATMAHHICSSVLPDEKHAWGDRVIIGDKQFDMDGDGGEFWDNFDFNILHQFEFQDIPDNELEQLFIKHGVDKVFNENWKHGVVDRTSHLPDDDIRKNCECCQSCVITFKG